MTQPMSGQDHNNELKLARDRYIKSIILGIFGNFGWILGPLFLILGSTIFKGQYGKLYVTLALLSHFSGFICGIIASFLGAMAIDSAKKYAYIGKTNGVGWGGFILGMIAMILNVLAFFIYVAIVVISIMENFEG